MKRFKSNSRIQISSRQKRDSGKSLNIVHNKRISKLGKDLLSKIDDILIEYKLNNDLIPIFNKKPSNNPNKTAKIEEQKIQKEQIRRPSAGPKIKMPKSKENLDFDPNMPNINISLQEAGKKKLPKVKKKKRKKKKDGFLTGVGIIKTKKDERENKFLAENDEAINAMLNNIEEIDNFINNPEKGDDSRLFEGSPDYKEKMAKNRKDFEDLIKEIDGYKKEMQEEFDEIQYLIKFTNNTEKLIDRHKNVINEIFKGAGLPKKIIEEKLFPNDGNITGEKRKIKRNKSHSKSRIQGYLDILKEVDKVEEEFGKDEYYEDLNDELLSTNVSELNGVFYKLKKINQIKDNLCNIQDDCLGYHEKLKETLKRSESAKPPIKKEEQKL